MEYHNIDFEPDDKASNGHTFRNKLSSGYGTPKTTISETAENLSKSIKYFESRIADYQKASNGASYFLNQLKSGKEMFDEASEIYWALAFDPCSRHAKDIFLSLDRVFEALRDKFITMELGQ